ncbi:MAG: response regulator transcription factor [Deltaproteobacteria bacterium]|nr:response regulator transcription factor [Deltaproteobacteria bacterium]
MPTVLVIDDDPSICEVVGYALKKAGYVVTVAHDGKAGLDAYAGHKPDLVVLDILMPGIDGIEVCRALRAKGSVPIVFLSSKDEEIDRIVGLEVGGDDYVTKPFSPRELVARVRAVLRRSAARPDDDGPKVLAYGDLTLDVARFKALCKGKEVELTATEFRVLQALMAAPGRVFTRDELMSRAYPGETVVADRTIDSHVKRVRQKFERSGLGPIDTVHGIGYRLSDCRKR